MLSDRRLLIETYRDQLLEPLVARIRGARLPRHRTQGDYRRQLPPADGRRRPGAHRAHAALAGSRPFEPPRRAEAGGCRLGPNRPWRCNFLLATQANVDRESKGKGDNGAVAKLLAVLREGSDADASRAVLAGVARGVPEQQLWTRIFLAAGDPMLKQSGIISMHANTSVNALDYAYRHLGDSRTRRLMLLQAAAFLPLFRELLGGERRRLRIDTLEAVDQEEDPGSALEDIFATVSVDCVDAARKTLGYLAAGGAEPPFMRLARQYVVERNTGYHDYKFAEAAFENAAAMQSPWRERYLAASVLYLNGAADKAKETVRQARSLLG